MTKSLFSALLLLLAVTAATGSVEECTIDCLHDTVCVKGNANFSWHPVNPATAAQFDFSKEIERNGWHCGCPPGLTGLRCGRTYESCNDGDHVCFNGGQCIATLKDIYQNDQQYCDCPSTVDDKGNTKRYSGKYCEVEVTTQSSRCTEDNNICQNGGTCKATVDEIDPCDCPDNYVGRMCEYFEPTVPTCNLQCQNDGSCRYGTKEENHTLVLNEPQGQEEHNVHVVHENFMYCECPSGYVGVHCETEEILCGDIKCKHGSTCVTVKNKDTGETTNHCDCAHINQQKLDKGETVQFAGRHCEIESSAVCHYDDDGDGEGISITFCANNGTCPEEAHDNCGCPDGFKGAHCQFDVGGTQNIVPGQVSHDTCKLECKNDGTCRKGTNQDQHVQQLIDKYGSELGAVGLNISYNQDFEHCACPTDFVGVQCEYSMKSCGKDGEDHPCFHGSTCTMINDVPTCVCTDASDKAAGIYCQHLANDVCSVEDNLSVTPTKNGNRGFCVNGGVCVKDKDGEAACRCHSQFEGPHCEYSKNSTDTQPQAVSNNKDANNIPNESSSGLSGGAKFGVALTVLLFLSAVAYGLVTYRRKLIHTEEAPTTYPDLDNSLALDEHSLRAAPAVDGAPTLDFGPQFDLDGNQLTNVELL